MVRSKRVNGYSDNAVLSEYYGLSTDTKPTENVATGSVFLEVDTGATFLYDEEGEDWTEVENGSSGGGGGGGDSDFSTAEVTFKSNISNPLDAALIERLSIITPAPFPDADDYITGATFRATTTEATVKIVLYKGISADGLIMTDDNSNYIVTDVIVSGGVTVDDNTYLIISGDGTCEIILEAET